MGLLDDLTKNMSGSGGGGITEMLARNPALATAALDLLSSRRGSIGPSDGLGGLMRTFAAKGMGDVVSSWISTGPNRAIEGHQVADALGDDTLAQFSQQAGIPHGQAANVLASVLPLIVDRLTPRGAAPEPSVLESDLGGLLRSFGAGR